MAARRRQGKLQRQQGKEEIVWDFLAFPTFVGFAGGAFIMAVLFIFVPWFYLLLLSLFMLTFAGSHVLFTGTRQRREADKRAKEEEDELEKRIVARREADDAAGVTSRRSRKRRGRA